MWYNAQDYDKPTVTPAFVFDSYEKGKLVDPSDYQTRGPEKLRKDDRRKTRPRPVVGGKRKRGRGRRGASSAPPRPTPSSTTSVETPKWLRFFKEAENTKSLQYIGAMFKKNSELTYDALAIHLHNKVRAFDPIFGLLLTRKFLLQISNHTINSWRKYCHYHTDVIEDLRRRAISNTERRGIPMNEEMTDMEATEPTLRDAPEATPQHVEPQLDSQPVNHQQDNPQKPVPRPVISQPAAPRIPIPEQPIPQQAVPQQAVPQQTVPQQTVPQQAVHQQTVPQQIAPRQTASQQTALPQAATQSGINTHHGGQPPLSPNDKVAQSGPIVVKTEPMDEDQLDFVFATEMLANWKPNEESDVALWKRMETMVRSPMVSGIRVADVLPATQRHRVLVGGIL